MKKKEYGQFIQSFADRIRKENWEKRLVQRETFLETGDLWQLSWIGHLASMEAALYTEEKRTENLQRVRGIAEFLCETEALLEEKQGRPGEVVECMFSFAPFMKALLLIGRDAFSKEEWSRLEKLCFAEVEPIFTDCEWGRHNRCALRSVALLLFSKLFAEHPGAHRAGQVSKWLMEDSLGNWSIEDATSYLGIWLTCITEYVQYTKTMDMRTEEILTWYSRYFAAMLLPSGGLPEFGDTRFDSATSSMLTLGAMELIAKRRRDGQLKYAAERQFYNMVKNHTMDNQAQMERGLCNAYLWADDSVEPKMPAYCSTEVLEEAIGKKAVFRSGWEETDTFLFYNYKDVGEIGQLTKDYLQRTIPVHAEKPHHGHADEQAINALCAGKAVLLRDGGYRDAFTTNGHYRADFYHNRMVVRRGRMFREKGFLEYAENIGDYVEVRTKKLYFKQFAFAQTIRTRLYDPERDVLCDRQLVYLPKENLFVVADTVQSLRAQALTAGVMYHAEQLEGVGERTFRIWEDSYEGLTHFHDDPLPEVPHVRQSLAVVFGTLRGEERCSVEKLRRNYRQETALSQYVSRYFAQGESYSMVSLLIPETGETKEALAESQKRSRAIGESLQIFQSEHGTNLTVCFAADAASYTLGIECDRERRVQDYNRRPAYTWESGKYRCGAYETDASFFISDGSRFGALDVTRVKKGERTLFEAGVNEYSQLDFVHTLKAASSWGCVEGKEG